MPLNESLIDNALMAQKDQLLRMLAHADLEKDVVGRVVHFLEMNCDLWIALSYGYKGTEILTRALLWLNDVKDNLHHAAHKQRLEIEHLIGLCHMLQARFRAKPISRMSDFDAHLAA